MQRVKNARDQLNSQAQWIQLGLLTASTLAPLVRRWNELRAMDQKRIVREDTAPPPREPENDDTAAESTTSISSVIFWVVGVGVGVAAAGVGTYLFLKRRMAANQEEPLLPLPFPRPGGTASLSQFADLSSQLAGSNHYVQGEAATSTSTSVRDQAPTTADLETAETAASFPEHEEVAEEDVHSDRIFPKASTSREPDTEVAAVVGNIRTLAYHFSDDANLPEEDNRVYFSSEDEARLAGFHHVTDEIIPSENSTVE